MSEIRIVGLGKTRGYPYPVCKKASTHTVRVKKSISSSDKSRMSKISPVLALACQPGVSGSIPAQDYLCSQPLR